MLSTQEKKLSSSKLTPRAVVWCSTVEYNTSQNTMQSSRGAAFTSSSLRHFVSSHLPSVDPVPMSRAEPIFLALGPELCNAKVVRAMQRIAIAVGSQRVTARTALRSGQLACIARSHPHRSQSRQDPADLDVVARFGRYAFANHAVFLVSHIEPHYVRPH